MRVMNLGSRTTTGQTTPVRPFDAFVDERVGVFQPAFTGTWTGTATVILQGRVQDSTNWINIKTVNSNDAVLAYTVSLFTEMRIDVTAAPAGVTVTGFLGI